ncbi:MAG: hypothetical protein ACK52I_31200 [Pseudomonadota bacterium]|jgi:hypothetical protein
MAIPYGYAEDASRMAAVAAVKKDQSRVDAVFTAAVGAVDATHGNLSAPERLRLALRVYDVLTGKASA